MKFSLPTFLITVFLASCATRQHPLIRVTSASVPGNTLPSEGVESVRYAENIKAYPMGRYIDPNDGLVMHEGHVIYRVESTGKWNLHPNQLVSIPIGPVRARDAAKLTSPVNDELAMEINRQKTATKTLIQGATALSQKLDELSAGMKQTQQLAEETQRLKQQINTTAQRVEALEEEVRQSQKTPANAPPGTPSQSDPNW